MTVNKNIKSPFRKDFGRKIHEEQKQGALFSTGQLKRTIKKKGRV